MDKIYTKKSTIKGVGRGVFAGQEFKKGDIIENAPFLEIPVDQLSVLNKSFLVTYFFYFGKNKAALVLGHGSLYNHSHRPNAAFVIKAKSKNVEFVALKDIKKDQEIFINYKGVDSRNPSPLWFE